MLISEIFIPTLKESPAEATAKSHKLMIRSSMIRKLSAGLYTYFPLGLRTFRKVENIIREEMNKTGAQEFSPSILTPGELWEKTGRLVTYGPVLIQIKDHSDHLNVLGPTHEEVFTEIVRTEISSYKQLPVNFYQIKTKIRDEIRPRYGVMRCREFTMKDAYSFDIDEKGLDVSYKKMRQAYKNVFKRCGLNTIIVEADVGAMGGTESEEFMVESEIGEATLVLCKKCGYAANLERAESLDKKEFKKEKPETAKEIDTPNQRTIEQLADFIKASPDKFIKTMVYMVDEKPIVILMRGDLAINEIKLQNALKAVNLELADDSTIKKITKADVGFAGPDGLKNIPIYADHSKKTISNSVTGANKTDKHIINVNLNRDFKVDEFVDIRTAKEDDLCIKCKSRLIFKKGIEVGHVFKLGYKYTRSMGVKFLDKDNKEKNPIMGCYGIGVDRTIAAIIEQGNDKDGIIWPITIAPFEIIIIVLTQDKKKYRNITDSLYDELNKKYEVLMDERNVSPGFKFKDADLIGIPIKLILSDKNFAQGKIEIKWRKSGKSVLIDKDQILPEIEQIIKEEHEKYEV